MADVTNELIFDVLKKMQSTITDMRRDLRDNINEMRAGFASSRQRDAATESDLSHMERRIAHNENDIERIKQRLELLDEQ